METSVGGGASWRIGIDVGGTFTDLVAINGEGRIEAFKTPSTPADPSEGVLAVLALAGESLAGSLEALLGQCERLIHGTTVATNTLLERKGAKVGLLTTKGFRDSLEIRRGIRETQWDHRKCNPPVLVPRCLRIGVGGRIDARGTEIEPLDEEAIVAAADVFAREKVEAIAICMINSFLSDTHECRAARIVANRLADTWISVSSGVAPIIGEYERLSTTVVNAYVGPRIVGYLKRLDRTLRQLGLRRPLLLMQSNGGAVSVDQVEAMPFTLLLSGPAAAVGALRQLSGATGSSDLISMEIGGTSCDVTLSDRGSIAVIDQLDVSGYHLAMPSVDIHTVGAGGGTVAGMDAAGMLYAGPRGAGAVPGPAAYGRGGDEPTVTDALLVLGRLRAGRYGGGRVALDGDLARQALARKVAEPLGISIEAAAIGILRLVDQGLLHAVQRISIERGYDPRRFTLVAAGGAGPMHGARIGRLLGCSRVYVPRLAGAFCAFGMLHSDVRHDFDRSYLAALNGVDPEDLESRFAVLEERGSRILCDEGFDGQRQSKRRALALRYRGQQWDLMVDVTGIDLADGGIPIRTAFERDHERLFGHTQPEGEIEIAKLRVTATGLLAASGRKKQRAIAHSVEAKERRQVYLNETVGWREIPIFDGGELRPGCRLQGPLIIDDSTTTIFLEGADDLEIDREGNYMITVRSQDAAHA